MTAASPRVEVVIRALPALVPGAADVETKGLRKVLPALVELFRERRVIAT